MIGLKEISKVEALKLIAPSVKELDALKSKLKRSSRIRIMI
jgi:hypothetical protein